MKEPGPPSSTPRLPCVLWETSECPGCPSSPPAQSPTYLSRRDEGGRRGFHHPHRSEAVEG